MMKDVELTKIDIYVLGVFTVLSLTVNGNLQLLLNDPLLSTLAKGGKNDMLLSLAQCKLQDLG